MKEERFCRDCKTWFSGDVHYCPNAPHADISDQLDTIIELLRALVASPTLAMGDDHLCKKCGQGLIGGACVDCRKEENK